MRAGVAFVGVEELPADDLGLREAARVRQERGAEEEDVARAAAAGGECLEHLERLGKALGSQELEGPSRSAVGGGSVRDGEGQGVSESTWIRRDACRMASNQGTPSTTDSSSAPRAPGRRPGGRAP